MADIGLSWRDQLNRARQVVLQQEKRREVEKRLARERNEEALTARLKEDTPEAISHRMTELRQRFDHAARKLYPLPQLDEMQRDIEDLGDLLRFYVDCIKSFPKVFSPAHRQTFATVLSDIEGLANGLKRQLAQWEKVKELLDKTRFRPRQGEDDATLVAIAKEFSERAHDVTLSIPGDYFSREGDNFWTVDCGGKTLGYMKYWPAEDVVTFAVAQTDDVNFNKFLRGLLYRFGADGPMSKPLAAIRVKITFPKEAKFFADLGFIRTETQGPSDWIYSREL
jgi:hypothetical protein